MRPILFRLVQFGIAARFVSFEYINWLAPDRNGIDHLSQLAKESSGNGDGGHDGDGQTFQMCCKNSKTMEKNSPFVRESSSRRQLTYFPPSSGATEHSQRSNWWQHRAVIDSNAIALKRQPSAAFEHLNVCACACAYANADANDSDGVTGHSDGDAMTVAMFAMTASNSAGAGRQQRPQHLWAPAGSNSCDSASDWWMCAATMAWTWPRPRPDDAIADGVPDAIGAAGMFDGARAVARLDRAPPERPRRRRPPATDDSPPLPPTDDASARPTFSAMGHPMACTTIPDGAASFSVSSSKFFEHRKNQFNECSFCTTLLSTRSNAKFDGQTNRKLMATKPKWTIKTSQNWKRFSFTAFHLRLNDTKIFVRSFCSDTRGQSHFFFFRFFIRILWVYRFDCVRLSAKSRDQLNGRRHNDIRFQFRWQQSASK